jgi:sugar porter (SP) family MFS transporter
VNQFAIIFGMLVVYFVNAKVASLGDEAWNVAMGWRWMFATGTVPAVVFFVLLMVVPESPRWLMKEGRVPEAKAILSRIGGPEHARIEIAEIQDALKLEKQESLLKALLKVPSMLIPLAIGVGLAILQQITGINVVLYYAPSIFANAGVATQQAINDTVIVGTVNLAFTLVAIWVVDQVGRKPLLLIASAGMGVSLALLGWAFATQRFAGPLVLVFVLMYVASFAVAMGPVVWVVMAEIFPTRIRGRAMSIATVCLWLSCFAVTQLFPIMLERLEGKVFFIYAIICAAAFVFVAAVLPETKGRSLEEIERQWFKSSESPRQSNG